MTKHYWITPVALLLLAILACTGQRERKSGSEIWNKDELVVAMDTDLPGYVVLDGEQFGYHYDILQDYAERIGATLHVITGENQLEYRRMLDAGEVDMIAVIATDDHDKNPIIDIYTTSYVMLAHDPKTSRVSRVKPENTLPDLRDKKILVSSGFKTSHDYDRMIDSMRGSQTFICENDAIRMIELLAAGEYDYLICEKSEALLGTASYRGLRTVYDFGDGIRIGVRLNKKIKGFREDFTAWFGEYRSAHEYSTLADLYLENANLTALSTFRRSGPQPISQYDDIIRLVAEREQLDWRFLSAIAYHESRFKSHVVSHMGARGIMQVMPVVARNFNIPVEEIADTETNVTLAAKLIKNIEQSMGFSAAISGSDKMSIVVACYNAGTGHITDARRLARKYGYNADSWENVSRFLKLKSQPEYYNDEVVRNGMFRNGEQTSAFVENVMDQYNNYRILARK